MRFQGSQGSRLTYAVFKPGRCVKCLLYSLFGGTKRAVEYYSLVFGKFRIVLTLSVVL